MLGNTRLEHCGILRDFNMSLASFKQIFWVPSEFISNLLYIMYRLEMNKAVIKHFQQRSTPFRKTIIDKHILVGYKLFYSIFAQNDWLRLR